ncbi:uncharacterized protein LOC124651328 isoform X2 [Lolium rigidum]|nr:uncharacterized protein LOC124651328 isoform X2 [Lolium rigidum]
MPPYIKRGGRSKRDAVDWKCGSCHRVNRPTKHLVFNLPKFRCKCGKQFEKDFHICLSDIKVNGRLLIGDVHEQEEPDDDCVAYALAHQLEITLRMKALLKKRDPLKVKKLCGRKLFEMFKKRCKDYFPKKGSSIKKRAYIKQVHMGLILKEKGLTNEDGQVCKVSNVSTIPGNDFEGIAKSIAEGDPLVSSFNCGKRLRNLKYGQIYKAYLRPRYRGNKRKRLAGHAVCLIGVGRKRGKPYCTFLNSWKDFCVRRNRRGKKYKWGVGRIRASDLKCSAIRLSRFSERGDSRSLQPQEGTVLSEHNLFLMAASIHEVENELEINGEESDDEGEALDTSMLGSLTDMSDLDAQPKLLIHIVAETTNKLGLTNSGVSQTKSDLMKLGTVASFVMKEFMERLAAGDVSMLGQFVASYLSQRVVVTIKHNDRLQCVWESQAGGFFAATNNTGAPTLKVYQLAYLEVFRLINNWKPIWIRKPEDNNTEYTALYKSLTSDCEEHLAVKHFSLEVQLEFKAILLVRKRPPFSIFGTRKKLNNIKLYVPLVFMMNNCEELIPEWLRFVLGIVDPEDLPLNISCQMPQLNKILKVVGNNLANMCEELLLEIVENEDHNKFYETFCNNLQLVVHDDSSNSMNIVELLRYCSIKSRDDLTSLKEYVTRMEEGQNDIYIRGKSKKAVENSPFRLKKWIQALCKEVFCNSAAKVIVSDRGVGSLCSYDRRV